MWSRALTITADSLRQTQVALQLPVIELWWRYFALGGNRTALEVEAMMFGALVGTSDDRTLLATALHEQHLEGRGDPSPTAAGPTIRAGAPRQPLRIPGGASPTSWEMLLERSADSPRIARTATRRWLTRAGCPPAFVADVMLVVSELVTNAVEHAASSTCLRAELGDDRLRLEVDDTSSVEPVVRDPDPARLDVPRARGGFGLRIVSALAADWGWTSTPTGKSVWVELDRRATVAGA